MLNISEPNTVYSCTYGNSCFDVVVKGLVGPDYVLPTEKIEYLLCLIDTAFENFQHILGVDYLCHIVIFDDSIGAVFENKSWHDIVALEKLLADNSIISLCKTNSYGTSNQ